MRFHEIIEGETLFIPLISFKIQAGFPSPAADYVEEFIDIVKHISHHPISTFYLYCQGDFMIDASIPPWGNFDY